MPISKINLTSGITGVLPSGNATYSTIRPNAKPLIINGDMAVAQRATSKTSITGGGYYTIDRFDVNNAGAFIGTWTQTQENLGTGSSAFTTDGFAHSLKMDCTTANASPAANSQCRLDYKFEGQDVQSLKHGTANAEKTTLSFWIKATKTGTNVVRMYKPDADRSCSQSYTVSSSNTWEKKVLNFPADTSGAVIADDNTMGLQMTFGIAMGSNNTSGTLQTTWGANTSANDYVGQVNNADSTSNNWEITGVQLEVGEFTSSTIPSFQHESYADNLHRCRRYCHLHMNTDQDGGPFLGPCFSYTSSNWNTSLQLVPPMRAVPTVTSVSGTNYYRIFTNGGTVEYNQIDFNAATLSGGLCTVVDCTLDGASGGTGGHAGKTRGNSSGAGTMMLMEAEL